MSLNRAKARQPEIIRTVQKDLYYTNELTQNFSDILRITSKKQWVRYNNLCKLFAEIVYHGFASINNLQTLGEEYTGIIQIDSDYILIPSKIIQLVAILLEFGGDVLYIKVLDKIGQEISQNRDILPESKTKLLTLTKYMKGAVPYIKAMHKTVFYFQARKYQLSKRLTGINYILTRHWLAPEYSLYGYKILGIFSFIQLSLSMAISFYEAFKTSNQDVFKLRAARMNANYTDHQSNKPNCPLCLESRQNTSCSPCGHLFCWDCILDWLDEREECPICKEYMKKSNIVPLRNY